MESYPNHIDIVYDDDEQYRKCLNKLFNTDENTTIYDDTSAAIVLDFVFVNTKTDESFRKLYALASATVISETLSTGLAVLFSYEFLASFHKCLIHHFYKSTDDIECTEAYIHLTKILKA